MTQGQESILVFPIELLKNCTHGTFEELMIMINKAYERQITNYGVVTQQRITSPDSFFHDLELTDDKCIFYVMVKDVEAVNGKFEQFANTDGYKWYNLVASGDLKFSLDNVKASIAYRPFPSEKHPNDYEISGFTSYAKGCGIEICNITIPYFKKHIPTCDRLVAKVIVEHELVPYYINKLDFVEQYRTLFKKDEIHKTGFHEGFSVSRDFSIATLTRDI